jgi:hypothetical protein
MQMRERGMLEMAKKKVSSKSCVAMTSKSKKRKRDNAFAERARQKMVQCGRNGYGGPREENKRLISRHVRGLQRRSRDSLLPRIDGMLSLDGQNNNCASPKVDKVIVIEEDVETIQKKMQKRRARDLVLSRGG